MGHPDRRHLSERAASDEHHTRLQTRDLIAPGRHSPTGLPIATGNSVGPGDQRGHPGNVAATEIRPAVIRGARRQVATIPSCQPSGVGSGPGPRRRRLLNHLTKKREHPRGDQPYAGVHRSFSAMDCTPPNDRKQRRHQLTEPNALYASSMADKELGRGSGRRYPQVRRNSPCF